MMNVFDEILNNEKLPTDVKGKVMKDIELIKLSLEMADLFILKSPTAVASIADVYYSNNPNSNNKL